MNAPPFPPFSLKASSIPPFDEISSFSLFSLQKSIKKQTDLSSRETNRNLLFSTFAFQQPICLSKLEPVGSKNFWTRTRPGPGRINFLETRTRLKKFFWTRTRTDPIDQSVVSLDFIKCSMKFYNLIR